MFHLYATALDFTYICKVSCILHVANNSMAIHMFVLHIRMAQLKHGIQYMYFWTFDNRPSMRALDLILNNKTLYMFVPHYDHDNMYFTYTCNYDCWFLRYYLFPYEHLVFYTCNLSCILHIGNLFHDNKNDTTCYIYINYEYPLFVLFLAL